MSDDAFLTQGRGFWADVESGEYKLKLHSATDRGRGGWIGAVYDCKAQRWLQEGIWADDAEDGKRKAQEFAAALPGIKLKLPLKWYPSPN
jgi:hypothetical protein